jgi:hypothetical protein
MLTVVTPTGTVKVPGELKVHEPAGTGTLPPNIDILGVPAGIIGSLYLN